jgi:Family of unknown function (DUF6325)
LQKGATRKKEEVMSDAKSDIQAEIPVLGPIDILALEFPGNRFKGEILRNLYEQVEAGTIRIIDLLIVTKSETGRVVTLELHELGEDASPVFTPLHASISQMITEEDTKEIGELLRPNSTAAVLLYENSWALKVKQAMLDANGRMLVFERIPHNVIQEALEDLASNGVTV